MAGGVLSQLIYVTVPFRRTEPALEAVVIGILDSGCPHTRLVAVNARPCSATATLELRVGDAMLVHIIVGSVGADRGTGAARRNIVDVHVLPVRSTSGTPGMKQRTHLQAQATRVLSVVQRQALAAANHFQR